MEHRNYVNSLIDILYKSKPKDIRPSVEAPNENYYYNAYSNKLSLFRWIKNAET